MEFASNIEPEVRKRRSTRIVQAVPVTLTGVDALGRPFQERTSTLFINCHGCRYQSKHYVLKNMWVTIEVPHPEAGREPRTVRGRITWIQRPRTVRELFQVGIELEIPGNAWGIPFPPDGRFPFPESFAPPAPALQEESGAQIESPEGVANQEWVLPEARPEDNVHLFPGPAAEEEVPLTLARQIARLVTDAKQQLQSSVRESAANAVAAETRPLLAALQRQLSEAGERAVHAAVTTHMEAALHDTKTRIEETRESSVETLRRKWNAELQRYLQEAAPQLALLFTKISKAHELTFERQLNDHLNETLERAHRVRDDLGARIEGAEASVERFQKEIDAAAEGAARRWQELLTGRAEEARTRLEELARTARQLNDEIIAVAGTAQTGWRARLDADLAAATMRWNEKVEASLESAARQAADRLARNSQAATGKLERDLTLRVAALHQSFEQAAAEAETALGALRASLQQEASRARASLAEVQHAAGRLEEFPVRLEAMGQATAEKMQARFEAILAAESAELQRRAETALDGVAERLQPMLEAKSQESLARLAEQFEQKLAPHIARAGDLIAQLAAGHAQAEELLRTEQERLQQSAERTVQESEARLEESVGRIERDFHETGSSATANWLAELEAKATDTKHTTFEALLKSADWYEKRAQTQMQASLDKSVEQATGSLREKAGEISGLFASELDRYSRTYVEHTQGQLDEAVKDAAEHTRALLHESTEAEAAAFGDLAQGIAERESERFTGSVQSAFEHTTAKLETLAGQLHGKLDADARLLSVEFEKGMTEQIRDGVASAREELEAHVAPVKEALRAEREAQERQFQQTLSRVSDDVTEAFKTRLENVSTSWLVTTVAKLGQESQNVMSTLAASTEQRLRETAAHVFAGVGETLRQHMLEFATGLASPPPGEIPPASNSPSENPSV